LDTDSAPAPAEATPEQAAQLQRLEVWNAKGLGAYPFIDSKEAFDALPDVGKAELIERHPDHAEYLCANEDLLPAELRLRMAKGNLNFDDQDALATAGYYAAVKYLSQKQRECMAEMWDNTVQQQQEENAANAKAREQEREQLRIASLERSNQQLRMQYIRRLHGGSGISSIAS
jgi:hypothetical protein